MSNPAQSILDYLRDTMPDYPFNPELDNAFVKELIADFKHVDILEEAKAFRWYHDNKPAKRYTNLRIALRRWLSNAWTRKRSPVT